MKGLLKRNVFIFDALYYLAIIGLIIFILYQISSSSQKNLDSANLKNSIRNYHFSEFQINELESFNINQICG